ncbi:haloacid dehalogenase-like hydrolase [Jannaschia sp. Os4]|uniref:haloacid dehalogenase-like hydrolase n=1 Tax=Jannaschia sp. Os4 TaxID=2807617 RepID=UPI00193A2663|nr:haloacid dehalogenase-like hydrolase [Jannaschia sp. Os4]MBM2575561.1 haloacid dehalogenase-like hydrolase [Jannaschia sp. Os4]
MAAKHPHIPRILLAFDFDRTLATDSVEAICAAYGISRDEWEQEFEAPLGDGWDEIVRRGQALIDLGRAKDRPLSKAVMRDAAGEIDLYPGVLEMPDRLRQAAAEVTDCELEFVVLSSGYDEIIAETGVADAFDRILASGFESDEEDRLFCVKRIVGHPAKALYLEALGKGLPLDGSNAPERAGERVEDADMHCPFDQMIYLGDGASDLQAFAFLTGAGGLAIALDKDGDYARDADPTPAQRVDAVLRPDYSEGAPLYEALRHAVLSCAHRIALRGTERG